MDKAAERICYYLKNIINIESPSGYTKEVIHYIEEELNKFNIPYSITNKGALIATLKGEDDENQITFSAHVDTLGGMVKGIKADGKLSLVLVGGYMLNSIEGENCIIKTSAGKSYSGTVQTCKPSVHISGDEARELKRTADNMEVVLDEKVFSKEDVEKLGIEVGDFICMDPRFNITASGFVKSRYLDDKASVAVLLYSMEYLKENSLKLKSTINFYISNYEEVGHGARAALPVNTKEFISVDMGAPGLTQNSSEYAVCICAKDSSGPYDYELKNKLVNICKDKSIPYKIDIYPYYSSDASAAVSAGWDIRTGLIGPGVFASHGYERTHMDSLCATKDLVINYCI
ncbi:M42 family metallopeptidase [Clostridium sp. 19966]|uniref:M42 family metallopeptidase n=1 Tax=Clostridium sp. 19966 TaxID=2768166 RepID=UPI0028DDD854|nr:M42 family metallopeptidase [Clostridium sp. 19966]MDT8715512.1 M42 family metallopeptidase [Clostridium sp. 19966]